MRLRERIPSKDAEDAHRSVRSNRNPKRFPFHDHFVCHRRGDAEQALLPDGSESSRELQNNEKGENNRLFRFPHTSNAIRLGCGEADYKSHRWSGGGTCRGGQEYER